MTATPPAFANRAAVHAAFFGLVWPMLTIVTAVVEARDIPYYSPTWAEALVAAMAGVLLLTADFLAAGAVFFAVSLLIFRRRGAQDGDRRRRVKVWLEPIVLFTALAFGVLLWYPGVSSQALLLPLAWAPFAVLPAVLAVLVVAGARFIAPHRTTRLAVAMLLVGALAPMPGWLRSQAAGRTGAKTDLVILGLDSISQEDDAYRLRSWLNTQGGAWYTHPVAPGLLTNPVWASVLTMRPVSEHGVFHTFQPLPRGRPLLLEAAAAKGYRTVSAFPDQLTCAAGSEAGFDVDHSGPRGWRQVVFAVVENNSILLPIVKPLLPRFWPSPSPPNHAGSFTYDLDRELREILTAGDGRKQTLVMAHLTYMHHAAFPRSVDLSWPEARRVLRARARRIRDRTFDWQDKDRRFDPIPMRRWKMARLQAALVANLEAVDFLSAGRLVVFSDHGDRRGITTRNFGDARYHHVLLATANLPRRSLDAPVSLIDIGALAGIVTAAPPADPIVEFAIAQAGSWPRLMETARLHWSGAVTLDPTLLARVFGTLKRSRPWADAGGRSTDR